MGRVTHTAKAHSRVSSRVGIRSRDTRPCPNSCPCLCNSLTWVARPSHTPVCQAILKKPPTDALRPIILDNACILCITTVVGTELVDAYSSDTVIASSSRTEVHDPWAFYLHATLLCQAFTYYKKFPTATSRRSLAYVSIPVWLIILSDHLPIIALPKRY
ncbi:hypothetical protein CXB51_021953 [Gossypium anomalum]|uniref:Uncharacterized protein n=1 Tax=Gossypium anomalum TaxID=47600 RepID=A0A8J5YGN4_9ROSI|nr:hypothetical protein CXB51_021953 [Gossypium anomalum]